MQGKTVAVVVAGAVAVLGLVYLVNRAGKAAGAVAEVAGTVAAAINPLSDKNIFYTGAGRVADAIGGGESKPIGVRVWEWFNPDAVAAEKAATGPAAEVTPANAYWGGEANHPYVGGAAFGIYPKP